MEIIDISMRLSEGMLSYEGDPKLKLCVFKSFSKDRVMVSKISMGLHSGTHVDAPLHYLKKGEPIDRVNLNSLIGKTRVLDLSSIKDEIAQSDLEKSRIKKGEILLLKTGNSRLIEKKQFSRKFVHLGSDAADYLAGKKIKAVGIDYLSIEKFKSKDGYVHRKLLSNRIPIIEGLDLRKVRPGGYTLICLPLRIMNAESAPARCVLIR
jgi:arylformamidase